MNKSAWTLASWLLLALPLSSQANAESVGDPSFVLSSPQIADGATLSDKQVYNGFGCSGQNQSPALQWQGAPAG